MGDVTGEPACVGGTLPALLYRTQGRGCLCSGFSRAPLLMGLYGVAASFEMHSKTMNCCSQ